MIPTVRVDLSATRGLPRPGRKRRLELEREAGDRVLEHEALSVEGVEVAHLPVPFMDATVLDVPFDGHRQVLTVQSDLMRPPALRESPH